MAELDIEGVRTLLPDEATDYGWDDAEIEARWKGTVAKTVREYWLDRVNNTAGFLDLTQDGLPASQLHAHARAMLAYWDSVIAAEEAAEGEEQQSSSYSYSRKIRRV